MGEVLRGAIGEAELKELEKKAERFKRILARLTADGRRTALLRYPSSVKVSLVGDSPSTVVADVLIAEGARRSLMNLSFISLLAVVIIDPSEGVMVL